MIASFLRRLLAIVSRPCASQPSASANRTSIFTLACACALLVPMSAEAQTAHFSYGEVALGGGFNSNTSAAGPQGVAVDEDGNVFVADTYNNAVKKMPPGCTSASCVTTLPTSCSTSATGCFHFPFGIAVDSGGNVLVSDYLNQAVKEIPAGCVPSDTNSCVVTLGASSSFGESQSVAVDGKGNVYVANTSANDLVKTEYSPTACASAACVTTVAKGLSSPEGVAVDGKGNIFFAETSGNTVKEIPAGCVPSTANSCILTLGGSFFFPYPMAVAVDASSDVFVVDRNENAVYELRASESYATVHTFASGFTDPFSVALDGHGNYFVTQAAKSLTVNNPVVELEAGAVNFGALPIGKPSATIPLTFTFDTGGTILSPQALTLGATGMDFAVVSGGTCTAGTYSAEQTCTVNVTFTPKLAGARNGAVVLLNSSGATIATGYVHGIGSGPQISYLPPRAQTLSNITYPNGVAVDGSGNFFVADSQHFAVLENGTTKLGSGFEGGIYNPDGVALDGAANVFFTDGGALYQILASGGYKTVKTVASGIGAEAIAADGGGNVFFTDNSEVREVLAFGGYTTVHALGGGFSKPSGIAVDGSGKVYVADTGNGAVKEIPPGCVASTCVKTLGGGFSKPYGVAADGGGNVYVVDESGYVKVIPLGCVASAACVKTLASFEDGIGIDVPTCVAVDGSGNLYVGDFGSTSVVELDYADAPSLTFPTPTLVGTTDTKDGAQTATLQNIGNLPLKTSDIIVSANFTLDGSVSTCLSTGQTLNPAANCVLGIEFNPKTAGTIKDSVTVTDNNLNATSATQTIAAQGTAFLDQPVVTWATPAPIPYGTPLWTSQLNATASVPGTFVYTPAKGAVLPSGHQVALSVTFTPSSASYAKVTKSVFIEILPATLSVADGFGDVSVGSISEAHQFTADFETDVSTQVQVLTMGALGKDFQSAGQSCTKITGLQEWTCKILVTFTPSAAGLRKGAIVPVGTPRTLGADGIPVGTIYISGVGTAPQIAYDPPTPTAVSFSSAVTVNGVAVDGAGNTYVADGLNSKIWKVTPAGIASTYVSGLSGSPDALALDGAGNLFISAPNKIYVMTPGAYGPSTFATGLTEAYGVAVDASGNVFIANTLANSIVKVNASLGTQTTLPIGALLGKSLAQPMGLAIDPSGNLYVADSGNNRILKIPLLNTADTTVVGTGISSGAHAIAVSDTGSLYIIDSGNDRIVKLNAAGVQTTVLSGSVLGHKINGLVAIAVDGAENLYLSDSETNRLLKIKRAAPPTLSFASTKVGVASSDSPKIVTVENVGNVTMTFARTGILSPNFSYGTDISSTTCQTLGHTAALTGGSSCTYAVSFVPASASTTPIDGSLVLIDDALNVSDVRQTIPLIGAGATE